MKRQIENGCACCDDSLIPEYDKAALLCGHGICQPCLASEMRKYPEEDFKIGKGCKHCNRHVKEHRRDIHSIVDYRSVPLTDPWNAVTIRDAKRASQVAITERFKQVLKGKIMLAAHLGCVELSINIPDGIDREVIKDMLTTCGFKHGKTGRYHDLRICITIGGSLADKFDIPQDDDDVVDKDNE